MLVLAGNMAFQNNFWGVNMLIGQYDYELERIEKTEKYQTCDHYRNYAAWLLRVKELVNQRPEND